MNSTADELKNNQTQSPAPTDQSAAEPSKGRPGRKRKPGRMPDNITVYFETPDKVKLQEKAASMGINLSSLIRMALKEKGWI